jgi:hypothetical protein
MIDYKQQIAVYYLPLWQMLLNLSGRSKDPTNLEAGDAMEQKKLFKHSSKDHQWRETLDSYGMQLSIYFDEIEKATECYEMLKDVEMGLMKASVVHHVRLFCFALICIENFRTTKFRRFKSEAKKHMDALRDLVENGAINVAHKLQLVEAEFLSLSTKDDVLPKYELAIKSASRAGFLHDGALYNYLCAKFCLRNDSLEDSAYNYLVQSCELYESWGAMAVASSIRSRHPDVFAEISISPRKVTSGHRSRSHFRGSFTAVHHSLSTARALSSLEPLGE